MDERTWLEDVLRRIPQYELGRKDYSDLLPGNWAAQARVSRRYKKNTTDISLMPVVVELFPHFG